MEFLWHLYIRQNFVSARLCELFWQMLKFYRRFGHEKNIVCWAFWERTVDRRSLHMVSDPVPPETWNSWRVQSTWLCWLFYRWSSWLNDKCCRFYDWLNSACVELKIMSFNRCLVLLVHWFYYLCVKLCTMMLEYIKSWTLKFLTV